MSLGRQVRPLRDTPGDTRLGLDRVVFARAPSGACSADRIAPPWPSIALRPATRTATCPAVGPALRPTVGPALRFAVLLAVAGSALPRFALAAPNDAALAAGAVCVEPTRDSSGRPDPELDRALRAAVPLFGVGAQTWRFVDAAAACGPTTRLRFRGDREPEVRYVVEVEAPGEATVTLSVDARGGSGKFALAEALCVNALLLLGQPVRPVPAPLPQPLQLWLAPTATLGSQVAVFGSEIGLQWLANPHIWLAGSVGFEAFGTGAATLGRYQYSVIQVGLLAGWLWRTGHLRLGAGAGLRERTWLSHLQTTALHEHYDVGIAAAAEVRASLAITPGMRVGLALRPTLGLKDVSVAAPGEPELFRVPRLLFQTALEVALDL